MSFYPYFLGHSSECLFDSGTISRRTQLPRDYGGEGAGYYIHHGTAGFLDGFGCFPRLIRRVTQLCSLWVFAGSCACPQATLGVVFNLSSSGTCLCGNGYYNLGWTRLCGTGRLCVARARYFNLCGTCFVRGRDFTLITGPRDYPEFRTKPRDGSRRKSPRNALLIFFLRSTKRSENARSVDPIWN